MPGSVSDARCPGETEAVGALVSSFVTGATCFLTSPKSRIFTKPSLVTKRFSGFTSR